MCGIFLYASSSAFSAEQKMAAENRFQLLKHRGPDCSSTTYFSNVFLGFHRLKIVDTSEHGMMPFYTANSRFLLIMNGEIYNAKELFEMLKKESAKLYTPISKSDCEVVVHLFEHYFSLESDGEGNENLLTAFKKLCNKLDGEFAIAIYDTKSRKVLFGVDELRVRPLFGALDGKGGFYLASELCSLTDGLKVFPIPPSGCGIFDTSAVFQGEKNLTSSQQYFKGYEKELNTVQGPDEDPRLRIEKYFSFDFYRGLDEFSTDSFRTAAANIRYLLSENVRRKLASDREIGFLLSGGLDSSLVCSIAARIFAPSPIRTFTFAFSEEAPDVKAANIVAKYIGSNHTTYTFSFEEGLDLLRSKAVPAIGSWDQTTIRASTSMLLGIREIKKRNPELVVFLGGEVADELLRGYLYNLNSPSPSEGRLDAIDRLEDITYFDGLRADRVLSSVSCELRLPFFSKKLLDYVLRLPPSYIDPKEQGGVEKNLLRVAFEGYLPKELLWRTKNALSDATSEGSGWKDFLKQKAKTEIDMERFKRRKELYKFSCPQTEEDFWYRELFERCGFEAKTVPYKWMPKWCGEGLEDSSATVLKVFHEDL